MGHYLLTAIVALTVALLFLDSLYGAFVRLCSLLFSSKNAPLRRDERDGGVGCTARRTGDRVAHRRQGSTAGSERRQALLPRAGMQMKRIRPYPRRFCDVTIDTVADENGIGISDRHIGTDRCSASRTDSRSPLTVDIRNIGLLNGIDAASSDDWSTNLPADTDIAFRHKPTLFRQAIELDAAEFDDVTPEQYVRHVRTKFHELFRSDHILDGHSKMICRLRHVAEPGNMVLLHGGKNVGKTKILRTFFSDTTTSSGTSAVADSYHVLYVDGRTCHGNIKDGMQQAYAAYQTRTPQSTSAILQNIKVQISSTIAKVVARSGAEKTMKRLGVPTLCRMMFSFAVITSLQHEEDDVLDRFLKEASDRIPLLILDQMDVFEKTQHFLEKLVAETKQNQKLAVLLVSSSSSTPIAMATSGDKTVVADVPYQDIHSTIRVTELSPRATWHALTEERYGGSSSSSSSSNRSHGHSQNHNQSDGKMVIGMGPRLATLLMSYYGGHLLQMKQYLDQLDVEKNEASATVLRERPTGHTAATNDLAKDGRIRSCLRHMSRYGSVRFEKQDMDSIAAAGVGTVISMSSEHAWHRDDRKLLIPTSQSVRMAVLDDIGGEPRARSDDSSNGQSSFLVEYLKRNNATLCGTRREGMDPSPVMADGSNEEIGCGEAIAEDVATTFRCMIDRRLFLDE